MNIFKAQNLYFQYENAEELPVVVLKDINITIQRGSFVALLGHNGSGKSTLSKQFNAMLLPSGGKMFVEDIDTTCEDRVYDIRRKVGLVLQNPDNQLVSTIVEEDVAFGPENLGVEPSEIRKRVDSALKAVGMYEYKDSAPHKLSGGQKQRIAIAGVLAMQPDCIVLDEPTAMLDPQGRKEVLDTILRLNKEEGITVVIITHYMDEAALADRVIIMNDGKVYMDGTPKEVFSHVNELRAVELDVPQPTDLCTRLRAEGIDLPEDILTTDECIEALAKIMEGIK